MNRSHRASLVLLPLLLLAAPASAQTAPPPGATPPPEAAPPAPVAAPAATTPTTGPAATPVPAPTAGGGGYDGPPASAAPAAGGSFINLTTLRILKEKGIISEAEYESAVRDIGDSVGAKGAGDGNTVVVGKWATTIYGFVEADSIFDTTQSLNDLAGSAQIARGGTYAGSNNRMQ